MKYQGGYQIIDLSGGDIFAKAQSAFETNKPVLVYDGGIASFGNVTKDSSNYIINYIIEDTLYQATIESNNTVTKTSTEIGGGEEPTSDVVVIDCRSNPTMRIGYPDQPTTTYFTSDQVSTILSALSSNKRVILSFVVLDIYMDTIGPRDFTLLNATEVYSTSDLTACILISTPNGAYAVYFMNTSCKVVSLANDENTLIDYSSSATVKLTDYTSSNPYTASADGYVRIFRRSAETTGANNVYARGTNDGTISLGFILYTVPNDGKDGTDSVFVRKGTQIYATMEEGSNAYISFNPIVAG